MTTVKRTEPLEVIYGALVGGLVSLFIATAVFTAFESALSDGPSFVMAMVGLVCALGLMVTGMTLADRFAWLGTALLFASGFTAIWSVALSFTADERWMTLLALGVATVIGLALGWRKFGRPLPVSDAAPSASDAAPAGDVHE